MTKHFFLCGLKGGVKVPAHSWWFQPVWSWPDQVATHPLATTCLGMFSRGKMISFFLAAACCCLPRIKRQHQQSISNNQQSSNISIFSSNVYSCICIHTNDKSAHSLHCIRMGKQCQQQRQPESLLPRYNNNNNDVAAKSFF